MQNNQNPLNKVVFIQKVAAFTKKTNTSVKDLFQLAYVNNSWNDTIKHYSFHLFEDRVCAIKDTDTKALGRFCERVFEFDVIWFLDVLLFFKPLLNYVNVPMLVCRNKASLDMMRLVFTKIVEVGGKDLLRSHLSATRLDYNPSIYKSEYTDGETCLMSVCSNRSSSLEVVQLVFENIVEVGGTDFLLSQLAATSNYRRNCLMASCSVSTCPKVLSFVLEKIIEAGGTNMAEQQLTAIDSNGDNCLMLACRNSSSSAEVVTLLFQKIAEFGSTALLESHLTTTNNDGYTCLMHACGSSSAEVITLLFQRIIEIGGIALLESHLTTSNHDGWTCLMRSCRYSRNPVVVQLILDKITELGGKHLLKSHITAVKIYHRRRGLSCLMLACRFSSSSNIVKLMFKKIEEVGGAELVNSQLTAKDCSGQTCLMLSCRNSCPEATRFIAEKVIESGGPQLLKRQLTETTRGWTCLELSCSNSSSPEVMEVLFEKIAEVGGTELLSQLLSATNERGYPSNCLAKCRYSYSPEVMRSLAAVLVHLGLFNEQYSHLDEGDKKNLRDKAGIDAASWVPDPESIAEVKNILKC